jgi:hypothetical protein
LVEVYNPCSASATAPNSAPGIAATPRFQFRRIAVKALDYLSREAIPEMLAASLRQSCILLQRCAAGVRRAADAKM